MVWRVLFRRCPTRSMTVVGDLAQTGASWGPDTWADLFDRHAPNRWRKAELTVNYRTPAEIMEVAARVLAAAAPELVPPTSVRSTGTAPVVVSVDNVAELAPRALETAVALQNEIGGAVAVISPPSLATALGAMLEDDMHLDAPVSVIEVGSVKGLEFDGVVVVEPGLIANESPQGLKALYVALTRATKRLTIVAAHPLPAVLGL